ncbi:hypothetical protein ACS0TY_012907 [Phlomoides rotata]
MVDLGVYISPSVAYRAKQKALKLIEGSSTDQYTKLWDYAQTLLEKNPESTVILKVDNGPTCNRFSKLYVCFGALKRGFKAGLRPWIGLDGTHKGITSAISTAFSSPIAASFSFSLMLKFSAIKESILLIIPGKAPWAAISCTSAHMKKLHPSLA